jgi:hypothetical protein
MIYKKYISFRPSQLCFLSHRDSDHSWANSGLLCIPELAQEYAKMKKEKERESAILK